MFKILNLSKKQNVWTSFNMFLNEKVNFEN